MDDLKIENFQHVPASNNGNVKQKGSAEFAEVMKGAIDNVDKMERDANRSIVGLLLVF
jgi:flagellar hook-basal body complex protein FliE